MPSHPIREAVSWVSNPGHIGRVGSFAVSAASGRVFLHTAEQRRLICVVPSHLDLSDETVAMITHLTCQGAAKLASSRISTRAYIKLVSSRHPEAPRGAKVNPDLPPDDKQLEVLAHRGARCDSETSSRRGVDLVITAPGAPLSTASAFVPAHLIHEHDVLASAIELLFREVSASAPSTKHDRDAAYRAALTKHLQLVR